MAFIDPRLVPKRKLADGCEIPCMGMGTFGSDRFSAEQVSGAVAGAIRCGYRLFDCASVYGNEDLIGKVFEDAMKEGVVKREELFITSKVWNDMHGQGDVLLSCAQTLKDLRLEYLDFYFVHWPFPNYHAPGCDGDSRNPDSKPFSVEEFMSTWRQMERLVDMDLVKNIGMSSMTIPKLEAVMPLCRIRPTVIEMELHPCFQQPELYVSRTDRRWAECAEDSGKLLPCRCRCGWFRCQIVGPRWQSLGGYPLRQRRHLHGTQGFRTLYGGAN